MNRKEQTHVMVTPEAKEQLRYIAQHEDRTLVATIGRLIKAEYNRIKKQKGK